ncbi:MAG: hypothetical protein FJ014_05690 [Chloroflexi bacterium]|nr:hypothetical protein [Chloroflexota bacterium]
MYIQGITHVAIDVASPTRMERFLRETFGLQTLRQGYWRGEYIRIMGSPHHQQANPGLVVLYLRPGIRRGRLNHVGFGVRDQDVATAVAELKGKGVYVDVDGDDMLYGPEELHVQMDSFTHPRPTPTDDSTVLMEDVPVDKDLPCLARAVHHMAIDVAVPTRMQDWFCSTFEMDGKRKFARRGEFISGVYYTYAPTDPIGRKPGLMPLFMRPGLPRIRLNHIAFDVADADGAIGVLESRGAKVDLGGDAIIHGPEDVWFQLTSSTTPYPVGHPANNPGVRYSDQT